MPTSHRLKQEISLQIKILGFAWEARAPLSVAGLTSTLRTQSGTQFSFGGFERIAYWKKVSNVLAGMLITIKDQKRYCELKKAGKGLRIVARAVDEGSQVADFNFVAINEASGKGLMTYHHGSWSLSQFCLWARLRHEELRTAKIEAEASSARTDSERKKAVREAGKKYPRMDWAFLLTPSGLKDLILSMQKIKSFSFTVATPDAKDNLFRPLMATNIRTETRRFVFKQASGTSLASVVKDAAKAIPNFIANHGVKRGKIEGVDASGVDSVLKIVDNVEVYDSMDFDDAVDGLDLDPIQFTTSDICSWLLQEAERHKEILR